MTGKLREQIQVIRAFWDCWQNGTKLNFRGEYYKATLMSPFFNPGAIENPNIPIYIAGVNTGLAKLAGEMCEGFHAHPFNSPRYMNEVILPAIEEGLQKEGRKRKDISVSMTCLRCDLTGGGSLRADADRILRIHAVLSSRDGFARLERNRPAIIRFRRKRRMGRNAHAHHR